MPSGGKERQTQTSPAPQAVKAPSVSSEVAPDFVETSRVKNSFWIKLSSFLREEIDPAKVRIDESDYFPRHQRLLAKIQRQTFLILALTLFIIVAGPFLRPVNIDQAMTPSPDRKVGNLIALTEPNLTDQAILSWVATSITEIMTFGFGDIEERIVSQQSRFTKDGWESFLEVMRNQDMLSIFKMQQLVLTTVPSNAPVIVSKGVDLDEDEIWVVEMPVVMTYMTNNDVRQGKRYIVRLIVARVPAKENIRGLGIKSWMML